MAAALDSPLVMPVLYEPDHLECETFSELGQRNESLFRKLYQEHLEGISVFRRLIGSSKVLIELKN